MYINPFIAGVLATLMVEIAFIIGVAFHNYLKDHKKNNNKEDI